MPPALNVAKVPGGCFRHFAGALKVHRFLEREIAAQVARPQAVIPALYSDKK